VFLHGGVSYVAQQKTPRREATEKMAPAELQKYPPPYYTFDPCPGCYGFLIVTAPLDAATLPFQAIGMGLTAWLMSGQRH